MTLDEITTMCDSVLSAKAEEYATPDERWHNFLYASDLCKVFIDHDNLWALQPLDVVCMFALKHYVSCKDIANGVKPDSPELVKEKAGDLVNYYLIYRCIKEGLVAPKTKEWLQELMAMNAWASKPWILGLNLLLEIAE